MKKDVKNDKKKDVLRWILLVPSVMATWYIVMFFVGPIPHLFYVLGWEKLLGYIEIPLAILCGFILPSVAMYFVAQYSAPKYKNIAGWGAVVFCALWEAFLIFRGAYLMY